MGEIQRRPGGRFQESCEIKQDKLNSSENQGPGSLLGAGQVGTFCLARTKMPTRRDV